jgi:hypothetical protein
MVIKRRPVDDMIDVNGEVMYTASHYLLASMPRSRCCSRRCAMRDSNRCTDRFGGVISAALEDCGLLMHATGLVTVAC